ncbi:lysylphosphatidylglycerol synthase domain-containing protein [Daejeonella sp. JGW-45]|uniref:lysylphosphatidylglycerol synthase domain-containing protein n=1 Tax=Daejeonella sp. JGW-45 TaxID=3034148 RepID=UPI0023EB5AEF|nr:lysylphosphatidylglycerol synthase domain-containing protein [Daejeonella sp. JGW-45]
MNRETKKVLSIIFKIAILVLAFGFIFQKLSNNNSIGDFRKLTRTISPPDVWIVLTSLFLLMLLNWTLEALKWRYLLQRVEKISTWKAIESVFCGLTWAVFTPNRIGEYGGRVFFLSPRKRIIGIVSMALGSVGQMVITNVLGAFALLWFVATFMELNLIINFALTFVVAIFCSFFLLFYFNIQWMDGLLSRIKFIKPFRRFFSILAKYKKRDLVRVLGYCVTRYIVFTTQYCLVINLLIPEIPLLSMVMILLILFFIQSALPSLDLLDIGVRAVTATYFFAFVTDQEVAIMAATACVWLINLIIPAILGSFFVLKLNFFGNPRN